MTKGPSARLWLRSWIIMIIILVLGFGSITGRLFYLQTVQGQSLQQKAIDQQLKDTEIRAKRGTIYDATGKVLARSATVWKIILAPAYFSTDEERKYVAEGLSEILELDYQKVLEKTNKKSYYVQLAGQVESEIKNKVIEFKEQVTNEYPKLANVIVLIEDYKRYYPYSDFASSVLGFTGTDDQGLWGIEYEYNDVLTGVSGRLVTAKNANGTEMPFDYEQKIDAQDGNSIVLTIDETVQRILEKNLQQGIADNGVYNRAVAIMMNVNTGAIVGMAVEGGFDLNNPFTISDEDVLRKIRELPEEKRAQAESDALAKIWRNKAVSDTYYPGSVFKIITTSMGLEEGVINSNSTFYCSGSYVPFTGASAIRCHNTSGHGGQDLLHALCNSCNPAFMQIGNLIGTEKFYQYYQAFGFSEKTGIDLPGESDDIFFSADGSMGPMDLAVASFGQNFSITPIQMITAVAAVANGGNLVTPYVVQQVLDSEGNVVSNTETKVKRRVISEDTAKLVCEMLEENAISGAAKNGYVAGYRVAGKTGTSEKKVDSNNDGTDDYIASFCGFSPADDPEYALLVFFDTPTGDNYYGSAVAAPVFASIMKEVLPYLRVEAQYTDGEMALLDTTAGTYTGLGVNEAKAKVQSDDFDVMVYGNGDVVISQIPVAGAKIPSGGTIVLYTDEESERKTVTVPDLTGMSLYDVNNTASLYNLNISITGTVSGSSCWSYSQDIEAGTEVSEGTVITVSFRETGLSD